MSTTEDKVYMSITITVILFFLYYLSYSAAELYLGKFCKKYVCFEFLSFGEFIAIWVAIIGLYFVVTSLDGWKNQYRFEEAVKAFKQLEKEIPLLNHMGDLLSDVVYQAKAHEKYGLDLVDKDFEECVKNAKFYQRIHNLRILINSNKNKQHQDMFEKIIEDFSIAINGAIGCMTDTYLSEPNYSENREYNLKVKDDKINKIIQMEKTLKKRNEKIQQMLKELKTNLTIK